MKFKFQDDLTYQLDAINSVVDLFDGQPQDAEKLAARLRGKLPDMDSGSQAALDIDLRQEVGAVGNNLVLDHDSVLKNLQEVQDRNGLPVSEELAGGALDFDVEMETGTGKTYVYLRTIFELAQRYNFSKFVILVPSVAIREGVNTSIALMRDHFRKLYPALPFDASVYSGQTAEEVQSFATSTNVQIMVMTIDSVRGDKNTRIIHQERDKLNGLRPIDYLKATRPVVVMDEPQNMESLLSQSAIGELDPTCTLRYSATHRKQRNVIYRLDPVDAHDLNLVKQIVVAETTQHGSDATPYIKLVDVRREPRWEAKLDLSVRKKDGSLARTEKWVGQGKDLATVTGNSAYENNWRINEISLEPAFIELTNHGMLQLGEEIGGNAQAIYREMIRETIREHLRKEMILREQGVKVLSLFFIDKVASYMGVGTSNEDADGQFAQWFDELFREERDKSPVYQELLPQDPGELRRAYFSAIRKKNSVEYKDTSGSTKADDDSYDLIMRDKARLLSQDEPVRFIFSHSALREGWDNPNVFQICTLREMGAETERRQTIGRGLRLPVNYKGERISDRGIAQLTVIANESYQQFAKSLQQDYAKAGVQIGFVRKGEFSTIIHPEATNERGIGYKKSESIWEHLVQRGFLDKDGKVLSNFAPQNEGFTLGFNADFAWAEQPVIAAVNKCKLENVVKPRKNRRPRKLNKQLYMSEEFQDFWDAISRRTTYRVEVQRDELIRNAVAAISKETEIHPLRIQVTKAGVQILRGGAKGQELSSRQADLRGGYDLPDVISELQEATSLTRKTIIDILVQSRRLGEFIANPNDYIQMVKRCITTELSKIVVEGIQYEPIAGSVYELRELQEDGTKEKDRFIDQMYEVKNQQKTDFDYVVYDSSVERQFAEMLDSREDIRLFMKLPDKFKIDTPVGPYNPDWAIVKVEDGQQKLYMIRETKSTSDANQLRPTEQAKIDSAKKHFAAIGVDYAKSSPEGWNL
ncbi:DEAD/DEAH box helicase family protein [Corynebacterium sanguinis]|uniref:restriction endonuclease n=1 Tax=Corynebacterium sanguinis TaxID=2594913 RepID=UPI00119E6E09|nr:DEAD/DEAH box helicase family protein [Corynebacterium sanguinis]MCT1613508.1 DEAD/DEAH box helicase family protein [Corynebacterium sanguinis]MCT2045932.1 DEAD/DEAH box helicase family protein [Corynebacterium sanguinis]